MESSEWGFPAVQIWCFQLLRNSRYIDFQIGHFAEFEQFKTEPSKLTLLVLFFWLCTGQVILLSLGKILAAKNNSNRRRLIKNSRMTHRIWHKSFSMIQSAGIRNWFPQSINKLQRFSLFISFCNTFFWLCMLRIKTLLLFRQYYQKRHLEPSQKSMVELFAKIVNDI